MYLLSIVINSPLTSSQLVFAYLGQAISTRRESVIALKRIQKILELPESVNSCLSHSPVSNNPSIELIDLSASWKGTEIIHSNNSF